MSDGGQAFVAGAGEEPSGARLAATLAVAGLVSGVALAVAFQVTKPIIDRNNARALRRAVYKVVPGSSAMQRLVLRDGRLAAVAEEETVARAIYGAYDDEGRFLGYAIENSGPGFQDTIRLIYGYAPRRGRVIGMEILESRETPGLGDKIFKDGDFLANFSDLAVEPMIVLTKGGRGNDNEVDAITGATISSKSVVKIINAANAEWLPLLPPQGREPALRLPPSGTGGERPKGGDAAANNGGRD